MPKLTALALLVLVVVAAVVALRTATRDAPDTGPVPSTSAIGAPAPTAPRAGAPLRAQASRAPGPATAAAPAAPAGPTAAPTVEELWDGEARVPAFADRREAVLRERVAAMLQRSLSFPIRVEVDCRRSMCELRLLGATNRDQLDELTNLASQRTLGLADGVAYGGRPRDEPFELAQLLLFSRAELDHAAYARQLDALDAKLARLTPPSPPPAAAATR